MSDECKHIDVQSWHDLDGVPVGMWSCARCGRKLEPLTSLTIAAPDMLEALRAVVAAYGAEYPSYEAGREAQDAWSTAQAEAIEAARAAIKKATT